MKSEERLARALSDYAERLERGDLPNPEDLLRAHPDLAEDLHEGIAAMDLLEHLFMDSEVLGGALPERLGDYRILREIGRGGMGVVYAAQQVSMQRVVALKALFPRIGRSDRAVERFQREARAAGKAHHTNIVPVYGLGRTGSVWFYVMELVQGISLARFLEDTRKLGVLPGFPGADHLTTGSGAATPGAQPEGFFPQVAALFAEVAEALESVHEAGVIHRDVKPSNLILADEGRLKLIDFGLAWMRGAESRVTGSGQRPGTPLYMSPELARGDPVEPPADIYALGATLYETLTLGPPHRGADAPDVIHRLLTREVPRVRRLNPRVPRDLETITLKALEFDPTRRYPSAGALAQDLRAFALGESIRARPVGRVGRLWRRARRQPRVTALIIAVVVLCGLGLGLWIRASRHERQEKELAYRLLCARAEVALTRGCRQSTTRLLARDPSAADLFTRAIALLPERPEAWLGRAFAYRPAAGKANGARLDDLERARRCGLRARPYHLARAFFLKQLGRGEEAARERDRAREHSSEGALDAFLEGRLLAVDGRDAEAILRLDVAIEEAPESSLHRYLATLARALARRRVGDLAGALEDLSALGHFGGRDVMVETCRSSVWRQLGQRERGDSTFRLLLDGLAPSGTEDEWLALLRGLSQQTDGDWLEEATVRAVSAHPASVKILLARARWLWAERRVDEQQQICQRILDLDPDCVRALSQKALGMAARGNVTEGWPLVRRALALAPGEPSLHNTRGLLLMHGHRFEEAEAAFRRARALAPANVMVTTNLAAALILMESFQEALPLAEEACVQDPTFASAHSCLAAVLWGLGRFTESVTSFEQAIDLGARTPDVHGHYGMALVQAGREAEGMARMEEALAMAERLAESPEPVDPGLAWVKGDSALVGVRVHRTAVLLKSRRFREALDCARRCTRLAPERPEPWEQLGEALLNLRRYEDALEALRRAVAIDPANHHPLCLLGCALHELGRLPEARQVLERSIPLAPSCLTTWFRLGRVRAAMGEPEAAIAAYRELLAREPTGAPRAQALMALASAFADDGRIDEGLAAQEEALEVEAPAPAVAHADHALYLAWLDRFEEAEAALRRALDSRESSPTSRARIAEYLLLAGRPGEARRVLLRLRARHPAESLVLWVRALRADGETTEARIFAARALEEPARLPEDPLQRAWLAAVAGKEDRARAELALAGDPHLPFAAHRRARVHALLGEPALARRWFQTAVEAGLPQPARAARDPDLADLELR